MKTDYENSYRKIMEYQNEEHMRNQKKIRWGIRCVILIPLIFLMLMFSMNSSKVVFLVLWIVSLFVISAYLIYVEYMDYTLQKKLAELGIKADGKIDELLSDRNIDSRLAGVEQKMADGKEKRIFIADFKRIKTNVVAVVIVIGLSILPCLYAWFNILSNWSPYGADATSNIKVAVASDDAGVMIDDTSFNMGETVMEGLAANDAIGWVFTDTSEEALEGVYSGEYYAALIMPEDFTGDMISFLADEMQHPQITYYVNEKKNAIAPKITDKAKTAVQTEVNTQFVATLVNACMEAGDTLLDSAILQERTGSSNVIDMLIDKLKEADAELAVYEKLLSSLMTVSGNASGTANQFAQIYPDIENALQNGQSAMGNLQGAANTGLASFGTVSKGLSATFGGISSALGSISKALETSNGNLSQFSAVLASANISVSGTKNAVTDMRQVIADRLERLNMLKSEDGYEILSKLLNHNADEIGSFMASPVQIETEAVYEVHTYGSAMAPFYTVLALWVGGLILVAIIHTKVEMESSFQNAKPYQQFFGRYLTFFFISQVQALITVLGNLYFIEIECAHPFLFWLAASCSSFVFSFLMYALTAAFGNIGEGIAIIIMVIQVAGAGCTFPIETLPKVFRTFYKFQPFKYAMGAMKEAVAGMYQSDYWENLIVLLSYTALSLVIGLVLAVPFRKINHVIEKNKEESGVML